MELDELKTAWIAYDKKLNENLELNERLLRKLNLENSKRQMNVPFVYELTNIVMNILFFLVLASATIRFSDNTLFLIAGIISLLSVAWFFYLGVIRYRMLTAIDYYSNSLVSIQKSILEIKKKYLKYMKVEFYLFPIMIVFSLPVLMMLVHKINLFENFSMYLYATAISLVIGYPFAFWLYNLIYKKKIKNTELFLEEIAQFEK